MSLGCGADILIFYGPVPMYFRLEDTSAGDVVNYVAKKFGAAEESLDVTFDESDKITSTILQYGKPIGLIGWDEEM